MVNRDEEDFLMVSGIQHFVFCKRQWALIHIEQQWEENTRTLEGQHVHRNADNSGRREKRKDKLIVRGMPIQSRALGLTGICDVVEFVEDPQGVVLAGEGKSYSPYPIEYKRGKPKSGEEDLMQLAAQALCLEEMLLCEISKAYFFYDEIKQRVEVELTAELKGKVKALVMEMHHYFDKRHTPKVKTGTFCKSCSLQHICMPRLMTKESVANYLERALGE